MKRHFCASVFVINPINKKVLLVLHHKFNHWVQPGGHIENNETPEEAAVREAMEETGIEVELIGKRFPRESDFIIPIAIQRNIRNNVDEHIDFVYLAIPKQDSKILYISNESNGIRWFDRDDLIKYAVFEDIIMTYDRVINDENLWK